ncbi:hypothetical protein NP493_448g01030 [Ridgeia piscesae]|uniref:Uncharacterized protein n=1 Tax=Ridgeia piscesae TaxID=27915 RepID=A0AAD9KYZ7_RIDPI|nr:hypothetical protein NP493_448g01030 [Ridgeia piscesae]
MLDHLKCQNKCFVPLLCANIGTVLHCVPVACLLNVMFLQDNCRAVGGIITTLNLFCCYVTFVSDGQHNWLFLLARCLCKDKWLFCHTCYFVALRAVLEDVCMCAHKRRHAKKWSFPAEKFTFVLYFTEIVVLLLSDVLMIVRTFTQTQFVS